MTTRVDGRYPGTITLAQVTEDQWDVGGYVLRLEVQLDGGDAVVCRQSLSDSEKDNRRAKRDAVLKELGLPWPFKSTDLMQLDGKGIDVNLKTSAKGRQNAYVATAMPERILTDEEIDAKLGVAADDNVPF